MEIFTTITLILAAIYCLYIATMNTKNLASHILFNIIPVIILMCAVLSLLYRFGVAVYNPDQDVHIKEKPIYLQESKDDPEV